MHVAGHARVQLAGVFVGAVGRKAGGVRRLRRSGRWGSRHTPRQTRRRPPGSARRARRMASNRVMVPVRLARWVPSQSVMPRATEAMAARWKHAVHALDRGAHGVLVGHVALDQRHAGRQVVARSGGQVVEHAHGVAAAHERVAQMRPDEPGAAGDEEGGHRLSHVMADDDDRSTVATALRNMRLQHLAQHRAFGQAVEAGVDLRRSR